MSFPKGITQDAMRLKRANGTANSWLAEHAKHKKAGTLGDWLATQDDLGVITGLAATSQPKPSATRERRNPLQLAIAASIGFIEAMAALEAYRGRKGLFEPDEFGELLEANNRLSEALSTGKREQLAIDAQVGAMAEKVEMLNLLAESNAKIAQLEAELAASQEKLRVTGNGSPALTESQKEGMIWNKTKGWIQKPAKSTIKARTAEQALTEENAA